MAELATQNESIALYHYLCQKIVGTEEHVKTLRLMNTIRDYLYSTTNENIIITSGSFGEGLEMRGSDLDVMSVTKCMEVYGETQIDKNTNKLHFIMDIEDTHPGFTKLRILNFSGNDDDSILKFFDKIGSDVYLSSFSAKKSLEYGYLSTIHGPCLTDKEGFIDLAFCLHSKLWITPAKKWLTRSINSWPGHDVKQAIDKHGVLFVPVGMKGSSQEDLEWRISFSVGEKFLIFTFNHTQLLCYALMKILLKDVIAKDINCRELLCSYFMKTVLFWICEELPSSIWKPENLISCYMRCLRRLIYCVEYKVCPHYFIPENNLFENKIQGQAQETLLNKLYILNNYGWKCILLSHQISNFHAFTFDISRGLCYLNANNVKKLLTSVIHVADQSQPTVDHCLEKVIYKVLSSNSSKIKNLYTYYMSKYSFHKSEILLPFEDFQGNKSTYKLYNTYISTLLLNTHHDTVSGWLLLASFFYKRKQYNTALYIVQCSLLKCSPEKMYAWMKHLKFSDIHYDLLNLHFSKNIDIVKLWRFFLLDFVRFSDSRLIPNELQIKEEWIIPPVVYAHFLCFLCQYYLNNGRQCRNSIRDLQLTIEENYAIGKHTFKAESYNILGIIFQMLGDLDSAKKALMQSRKLHPCAEFNIAFKNDAWLR